MAAYPEIPAWRAARPNHLHRAVRQVSPDVRLYCGKIRGSARRNRRILIAQPDGERAFQKKKTACCCRMRFYVGLASSCGPLPSRFPKRRLGGDKKRRSRPPDQKHGHVRLPGAWPFRCFPGLTATAASLFSYGVSGSPSSGALSRRAWTLWICLASASVTVKRQPLRRNSSPFWGRCPASRLR